MLRVNVVEPVQPECGFPIIFIPNLEGFLSFCVHYRKMNAFNCQLHYLIPRIGQCFGSLGENSHILVVRCEFITLNRDWWLGFGKPHSPHTILCTYFHEGLSVWITQRALSNMRWKEYFRQLDDILSPSTWTISSYFQNVSRSIQNIYRKFGIYSLQLVCWKTWRSVSSWRQHELPETRNAAC